MKISQNPTVGLTVAFEVSEAEARALYEMSRYDADAILKVFYEHIGQHYLRPHEVGFRTFFKEAGQLGAILDRLNKAREAFKEKEQKP